MERGQRSRFAEMSTHPDYSKIYSQSKMGYILYKELNRVTVNHLSLPILQKFYIGWYKRLDKRRHLLRLKETK